MFTRFVTHGLRTSSWKKRKHLAKALYSKSVQQEVKEIEIPVPWGKVAGKLWGSQDKQPILAMHGWQDNAASFDNIAPLIMKNTPVLAIDLPGHGLSSWIPPGFMYNELIYFLLVKRIKQHFGWEKIKTIMHSLSAMMIYWYAATFPTEIQYVIALDFFKFRSVDITMHTSQFGKTVDAFFKIDGSNIRHSYTQSELIKKATEGPYKIDESAYKILMTRGTTQKEDGMYVVNRDPRLRVAPVHGMFSLEQLEDFARRIKCPYLIIKGNDNFYPGGKEQFYRALEILGTANDKVQYETIPATHHLHLTHAEDTAAIIKPFLEKYD